MNKAELIKANQILYSWNWFYLNSQENLQATRYHKTFKEKYDNVTGVKRIAITLSYIDASERFKEDRIKARQCQQQINKNQEQLNILFKS